MLKISHNILARFAAASVLIVALAPPQLLAQIANKTAARSGKSGAATLTRRAKSSRDVLQTLRREHPRLLVLDDELPAVKQRIKQDSQVREWYERLQAEAAKMIDEPPIERVLDGPRLLEQSRLALRRITTLAGLYRLDGDRRKAERARIEMLAAAKFSDWNPTHFLDTAEMTAALGIGYDWLFDYLSLADRQIIRRAIVEKGLQPGARVYRGETATDWKTVKAKLEQGEYLTQQEVSDWWTRVSHNWNQVCNGGLTIGALAVAEDEPELARLIVEQSRASIPVAMRSFAPDGGLPEGPIYWNYATRYNVFYLAALESALGTAFGLAEMPGFGETGAFRIHANAPNGSVFNFGDNHEGETEYEAAQMLWLASRYNRLLYAAFERRAIENRGNIFHLLWSNDAPAENAIAREPLDSIFRGIAVATFRSDWNDRNAAYVGFKGGDNAANHGNLDLGTFVFDSAGVRWAVDLGRDDYALPGYFGDKRWTYYRMRTEGQNALLVDNKNQNLTALAPLVAFRSAPERAFAVADLTEGYAPTVTSSLRGVALLDRRALLVQDEIRAQQPVEVLWQMHTRARVEIAADKQSAQLVSGAQRLNARIIAPAAARFEVVQIELAAPQKPTTGTSKLLVRLPNKTANERIVVLLAPADFDAKSVSVTPLQSWIAAGKLRPNSTQDKEKK